MWRLIYSKKKFTSQAKKELERKLNNFDFSLGASTSDLDLSDELSNVHFSTTRWGMNQYVFIAQKKMILTSL